MAYYELQVVDSAKAHDARVRSYRLHPATQRQIAREAAPAVGSVWTGLEDTCPDGLPNCRNCGDPQFAESCRKAGHCPHCGTKHGIAPDSVLAANGLTMVEASKPEPPAVPDA
jgi:hypothetical protein